MTEDLALAEATYIESTEKAMRERFATRPIPAYMIDGLVAHVLHGQPTGDFLYALLMNDFMEAARRAEPSNVQCLGEWADVLYNDVPMQCRGSAEARRQWCKKGGLVGIWREQQAKQAKAAESEEGASSTV